jgi:hypothetical protein
VGPTLAQGSARDVGCFVNDIMTLMDNQGSYIVAAFEGLREWYQAAISATAKSSQIVIYAVDFVFMLDICAISLTYFFKKSMLLLADSMESLIGEKINYCS